MLTITTPRLSLTELSAEDGAFLLRLLNQPSFIEHIGDKGVRDQQGVVEYLKNGPQASYREQGFGLWKMTEKATGQPVGMAGLLQRDYLSAPDLGYALLSDFEGRGYAFEANQAVLDWARQHQYKELFAICSPDNPGSLKLLSKLGFKEDGMVCPPGEDTPICQLRVTL